RHPPRSTPLPYTTLFRSRDPHRALGAAAPEHLAPGGQRHEAVHDLLAVATRHEQIEVAHRVLAAAERARGLGHRHPRNALELGRSEEHTSELQSPDHLVC